MDYQEVLEAIKRLPYAIESADGQYIKAVSVHKWDVENGKCLSANGKRIIQANVEPAGDKIFSGQCFYGIREDGDTRCVFNGIITHVDQIPLLEQLTNSFLW